MIEEDDGLVHITPDNIEFKNNDLISKPKTPEEAHPNTSIIIEETKPIQIIKEKKPINWKFITVILAIFLVGILTYMKLKGMI